MDDFNGGTGWDILVVQGNQADYTIVADNRFAPNGIRVVENATGITDWLHDAEVVRFASGDWPL